MFNVRVISWVFCRYFTKIVCINVLLHKARAKIKQYSVKSDKVDFPFIFKDLDIATYFWAFPVLRQNGFYTSRYTPLLKCS